MAVKLNETQVKKFVTDEEIAAMQSEAAAAHEKIEAKSGAGNSFLGWAELPVCYDRQELDRILAAAEKIKKSCDVLIVIGIGGSYLGARAAIDFIKSPLYNNLKKDTPDIYFVGNNISSSQINEIIAICENRDVCINIISKSGKTTEPAIAFRIFRELMEKKYGEGAGERIFATTDKSKGTLKELADLKGYETFVVPDDIGGRYSVLTAVGLLPIAVCGADVKKILSGAMAAYRALRDTDIAKNDCLRYAAIRNILYRKGKKIEIFAAYEPSCAALIEWWKQLYGESEGKDGNGIFPASAVFSTDLHSFGQLIQDGERNLFETVLDIAADRSERTIPVSDDNSDGLAYLSGKTMHFVNRTAFKATLLSHVDGGVPNIVLEADARDEENFGYLVYFFERACAVSGYIQGVNPFDQPGVEGYKNNMYALLGKSGAENEALREKLLKRLG